MTGRRGTSGMGETQALDRLPDGLSELSGGPRTAARPSQVSITLRPPAGLTAALDASMQLGFVLPVTLWAS